MNSSSESEKRYQSEPLKRIDVPNRVLRWTVMTVADLLTYQVELEGVISLLEARMDDRRLIPMIRRRAKNKLRRAKGELGRTRIEIERRKESVGLDEPDCHSHETGA